MATLNQCYHIGKLTRDPEITTTPGGKTIATFTLAITEKTKEGETTDFFDYKAWSPIADSIGKYCTKGREILVLSKSRQERWQDKQTGKQRSRITFLVHSVQFLSSTPQGTPQTTQQRQHQQAKQNAYQPQPMPHQNDDDIPF